MSLIPSVPESGNLEERRHLPRPPGLHWTLVLLLSICTAGLFLDVWMIVHALWARKVDPQTKALALYIAGIAVAALAGAVNGLITNTEIAAVVFIAAFVLITVASFSVRDALGRYITGITGKPTYLSGVMTILFGPIYFQYHMNKVRAFQRHAVASGA